MRSYFHVDTDAGICRVLPLPPEFESLGGRALASLLVAQKPGRLCLAPGLLTGVRCASTGRCAVSCSQDNGVVRHSNAGGSVGLAMAEAGLAALVVEGGQGREKPFLYDLVIAPGEASLRPASAQGLGISSAMEKLSHVFQGATALVTAGPAAECSLPMASLSFSNHRLRASSHAGSGSGTLLCRAGLHSIVFLKGDKRGAETQELAEATHRFMGALKSVRGEFAPSSSGCTSSCVLACHKGDTADSSPSKKGGRSGWPCFHELWSSGNDELDALHIQRFMAICNELGADAFILGHVMAEALDQGLLARRDAEAALAELEKLAVPAESVLFPLASAWTEEEKKAMPREDGEQGVIMDCLGVCRFAADAMVRVPAVRTAMLDMVRCLHGLSLDDLYVMASAVLQVESGQALKGEEGVLV